MASAERETPLIQEEENPHGPHSPDTNDEHAKLGGRPPVPTICHMTVGPLMSQLCQSMYGLMDSFWISKSIGTKGMTVMSLVFVVDCLNIAIAAWFNVAMSARISYLFGKGKGHLCPQVVVDLLRIVMIAGLIVPAILLPCVKPIVRWFGADDELSDMCMEYLVPPYCCSMLNYTFLSLCGLLQAMGNSFIYGVAQVAAALLNMFCFDPLFLIGFKTGIWGASVATILSYTIPMVVIYFMLFRGKFTVKPKLSMFFNKFNKHCWRALIVSSSQLIANLSSSLPSLVAEKLCAMAATNAGCYREAMAGWNVTDRIYVFAICVCNAVNQGYLPSASYAFGSNRLNRLMKLAIVALGLGTGWTALICIVCLVFPRKIASIWGHEPLYLDITQKMVFYGFCTTYCNQSMFTLTATLQAMMMVKLSVIISFILFLIPMPVSALVLYYTKNDDPPRILLSFIVHDLSGLLIALLVVVWKLWFLVRESPSADGWFRRKEFDEATASETRDEEL